MKPDQILIITDSSWQLLRDGRKTTIPAWSDVSGTTLVFFDFSNSQSGLISSKGKEQYAAAIIEKEVRTSGALDGAVKVFVHNTRALSDTIQSFYTAISLESWQELQNWATRQADHCLLIPMTSLIARSAKSKVQSGKNHFSDSEQFSRGSSRVDDLSMFSESVMDADTARDSSGASTFSTKKTRARSQDRNSSRVSACRIGNQIHAFADHEGRLHYGQVTLLGRAYEDVGPAVRALAEQLTVGSWGESAPAMDWITIGAADMEIERAMAAGVAQSLHLNERFASYIEFPEQGESFFTSLHQFSKELLVLNKSVPGLAKIAWLSESWAAPVSAVVACACLIVGGLGYYLQQQMGQQEAELAVAKSQSAQLQTQIARLAKENLPLAEDPQFAFANKIAESALYDPVRMLSLVRQAAGSKIRIQRVQLTRIDNSAKHFYRVEGVAAGGANQEIANFTAALKAQGWQSTPAQSSDGSIGAFAYTLRPVATATAKRS